MNPPDEHPDEYTDDRPGAAVNEPADARRPDPDAALPLDGPTFEGSDRPEESLPPGGSSAPGPRSDVDRAVPYDEQPFGLRMHDQPLGASVRRGARDDRSDPASPGERRRSAPARRSIRVGAEAERLTDTLSTDPRLDAVAERLDGPASALSVGPAGPALRGEWLGHALHPMLTDVALGSFMSATVLDVIGGSRSRAAARRLVGVGLLASVPTAASGLTEFAELERSEARRVAAAHSAGNAIALACWVASWRRRRHGRGGALWSLAGIAAATATGYLGGHLSFVMGAGQGERTSDDRVVDLRSRADRHADGDGRRAAGGPRPSSRGTDHLTRRRRPEARPEA